MRTIFISLSVLVIVLNTVHGEKTEPGLFTSQAIGASYNPLGALGYGCYRMTTSTGPYDLKTQNRNELADARGYWISISPTLKAKVDRIIFLNTATINGISINESPFFLEIRSYLPHRAEDVDLVNGTFLLYENRPTLLTGVSLKNAYVYGTSLFSRMLSGMVVVKTAPSSPLRQFLIITAGIYLKDPLFARSVYCACFGG